MELLKERFEAWLFSQPDEREWDYLDNHECAGCCFVKETTNIKHVTFGSHRWNQIDCDQQEIPEFLRRVLWEVRIINGGNIIFTAAEAKAAWHRLFPELTISETSPVITPQPRTQKVL